MIGAVVSKVDSKNPVWTKNSVAYRTLITKKMGHNA